MLKDLLNRVLELAPPPTIETGGHVYSTVPLTPVKAPTAKPLELWSLTGLAEYLNVGMDRACFGDPSPNKAIIVDHPGQVSIVGILDRQMQRTTFATAALAHQAFRFAIWHDQESFLIAVMTLIQEDEARNGVLRLAGQVTAEQIATSADDGITQTASAKAGYVLANRLNIKNPVRLRPWRTFREVEQPASEFVFRVRKGLVGPEFALFEADGGVWKVEAANSIREYLQKVIPQVTVLA